MKRPDTVPANATWDNEDELWQLGEQNPEGNKTGTWRSWNKDGQLSTAIDYRDGTPPFRVTGYHPDGTLAREGNWYGDTTWLGTYRWIRSENPTTENFPAAAANNPEIWIAEYDYCEKHIINAQRYFNKKHQPVAETGIPLPERPFGVPENAFFIDNSGQPGKQSTWVSCQVDGMKGLRRGDYLEWDTQGVLIVKRLYDPITYIETESYFYKNEQLYCTVFKEQEGEYVRNYYHDNITPPVIKESILYKNGDHDRTHTYFDEKGHSLLSCRYEKVDDDHQRTYYNGLLIHESISGDHYTQPPVKVEYYNPEGTVMIAYKTNGNGTGNWEFYEKDGQVLLLPVNNEAHYNRYHNWDTFLSTASEPDLLNIIPEWNLVKAAFMKQYAKGELNRKMAELPVPAFLQKEFAKIRWDKVSTAMEQMDNMPDYINGVFAGDEEIAQHAINSLWIEIEHQGSVYEATYVVGTIVARYLLQFPHIQERLLHYLFSILSLPDIYRNKKRYAKLVEPLPDLIPVLCERLNDVKALYILMHAGPTAAICLKQAGENKACALFALGELYMQTQQQPLLISEFSGMLAVADDPLIRLVLAVQLITAAREAAQDTWLATLVQALLEPQQEFDNLQPFLGDYDSQEYILMVLGYAHPASLEQNLLPVINMLTTASKLKQETLLQIIFTILFPKKTTLKNITLIRKQALLAAATVIDTETTFVNHKVIFDTHGIPFDIQKLRQLAATAK